MGLILLPALPPTHTPKEKRTEPSNVPCSCGFIFSLPSRFLFYCTIWDRRLPQSHPFADQGLGRPLHHREPWTSSNFSLSWLLLPHGVTLLPWSHERNLRPPGWCSGSPIRPVSCFLYSSQVLSNLIVNYDIHGTFPLFFILKMFYNWVNPVGAVFIYMGTCTYGAMQWSTRILKLAPCSKESDLPSSSNCQPPIGSWVRGWAWRSPASSILKLQAREHTKHRHRGVTMM